MKTYLVYSTCGSKDEALKLGGMLVETKLAACVNVIEGMISVYEWKGQIQHDQEVILIAKTSQASLEGLRNCLIENHSYECPCVVELPIESGNPEFLQWIANQTPNQTANETIA